MRISDWSSDVCSSDLFVEPAEAEIEAGLEGVCRLGGDVIDRAAGGVLPEKGALRAFERFDALEVQSSPSRHCNKRQGNLVDIDRNGRSEEHTSALQSIMSNSYAVFCFQQNI